jgi:hypothetical protein
MDAVGSEQAALIGWSDDDDAIRRHPRKSGDAAIDGLPIRRHFVLDPSRCRLAGRELDCR